MLPNRALGTLNPETVGLIFIQIIEVLRIRVYHCQYSYRAEELLRQLPLQTSRERINELAGEIHKVFIEAIEKYRTSDLHSSELFSSLSKRLAFILEYAYNPQPTGSFEIPPPSPRHYNLSTKPVREEMIAWCEHNSLPREALAAGINISHDLTDALSFLIKTSLRFTASNPWTTDNKHVADTISRLSIDNSSIDLSTYARLLIKYIHQRYPGLISEAASSLSPEYQILFQRALNFRLGALSLPDIASSPATSPLASPLPKHSIHPPAGATAALAPPTTKPPTIRRVLSSLFK